MSIVEFVSEGLERRGERRYLAGCLLLACLYAGSLAWFLSFGNHYDRVFVATRAALRASLVAAHPVRLDEPVRIRDGAIPADVALLDGWSVPEAQGIWSDGPTARLALKLPPGLTGKISIALDCDVMLDHSGSQTVAASLNGSDAVVWHLDRLKAVLHVGVPADLVRAGPTLILTLRFAHPTVPTGGDSRALGVKLQSVTVSSAS